MSSAGIVIFHILGFCFVALLAVVIIAIVGYRKAAKVSELRKHENEQRLKELNEQKYTLKNKIETIHSLYGHDFPRLDPFNELLKRLGQDLEFTEEGFVTALIGINFAMCDKLDEIQEEISALKYKLENINA